MKLLEFLACPACEGEIHLTETSASDGNEMLEGTLSCAACGKQFPIVRGVPRFADLADIDPEKAATASSFGFEWQHFTQEDDRYGDQLLGWLAPVKTGVLSKTRWCSTAAAAKAGTSCWRRSGARARSSASI